MGNYLIVVCAAVFSLSTLQKPAAAQQRPNQQYEQSGYNGPQGDWEIQLGAFAVYRPEYEGSDDYEFTGLPLINIEYKRRFFINTNKGAGVYLWKDSQFEFGVGIGYVFGRDEDDSDDLEGLGDIDGGASLNVFAKYEIGDISFGADFLHQISGDDTGFLVDLNVAYDVRISDKFFLKPEIITSFASDDYMDAYFGVAGAQSLSSGLATFDPDSGFKGVGGRILGIYSLSDTWIIQGMLGYERLLGDAVDSPVVQDENQYRVVLGLAYRF